MGLFCLLFINWAISSVGCRSFSVDNGHLSVICLYYNKKMPRKNVPIIQIEDLELSRILDFDKSKSELS